VLLDIAVSTAFLVHQPPIIVPPTSTRSLTHGTTLSSSSTVESTTTLPNEDVTTSLLPLPEPSPPTDTEPSPSSIAERRQQRKRELFGVLGNTPTSSTSPPPPTDRILADPITREPLTISTTGPILGGQSSNGARVSLRSPSGNVYSGRTDTYYDLLEPESDGEGEVATVGEMLVERLGGLVPGPVRAALAGAGIMEDAEYIPMRDLFTSPSVSFAYERGWRQGFAAAGFPGADQEYNLVKEYFAPIAPETVVDMSCATGLFTRRLAKGGDYTRVIGCDYSSAMLGEARARIQSDPTLTPSSPTQLDLIRCDVGQIPMSSSSVDALHAGAAMHCWPDLDAALSEVHRVLRPGGKFFATTFLASYFRGVARLNESGGQEQQAFQYFESVEELEGMVRKAGFGEGKVTVELLKPACVVIRAEK